VCADRLLLVQAADRPERLDEALEGLLAGLEQVYRKSSG
jgi:hypothetical protein